MAMSDSDAVARRTVVVTDPVGVHIRTAAAMAQIAGRSRSQVTMIKGDQRAPATNPLQVVGMITFPGEAVTLEAAGPDADAVLDALEPLFAGHFPEEANQR
jgi:phosphotransferase system HPr (HPr) family protein